MKNIHIPLALAVIFSTAAFARAQSPSPSPSPSMAASPADESAMGEEGGKHHKGGKKHGGESAALTPEENQKVMAARKAAMEDPDVKAAGGDKKAMHKAMTAAMIKADPSVAPLLEKMKEAHKGKGGGEAGEGGGGE